MEGQGFGNKVVFNLCFLNRFFLTLKDGGYFWLWCSTLDVRVEIMCLMVSFENFEHLFSF